MQTTDLNPSAKILLRSALLANAVFSLITGSLLTVFSTRIAGLLGPAVAPWLILSIGASLLPFGGLVGWLGLRRHPAPLAALAISAADLAWVSGSAVLLAFTYAHLTPLGIALVIGVAGFVFCFAVGQLRGISRCYRVTGAKPGRIRVCLEFRTQGDAEATWRNVAALGSIARFAPSLASSALRDDAAPGVNAVRACSDHAGRRWAERCTRFDPVAHELEMEFLADEPGFPFPFATLRGGWSIRPSGEEVAVRIWWQGDLRSAALSAVVPPLLEWQAQRQFAVVVGNMAGREATNPTTRLAPLTVVPC